ncbi:hypothetical protein PG993_014089 [Apiospora rasikravindrae]|uniref:Uncharacterized protein n=1 Tax=Apiospora rasikravindrae TaxID=990691 RepID=A0ABR1RU35_9PEZI
MPFMIAMDKYLRRSVVNVEKSGDSMRQRTGSSEITEVYRRIAVFYPDPLRSGVQAASQSRRKIEMRNLQ